MSDGQDRPEGDKPDATDELLARLGQLASEEAADELADERWDAMARGELSEEEQRALLATLDEDAGDAEALFAPIDAAARTRFADAVRAELSGASDSKGAGEAAPVISLDAARRRRKRFAWGGAIAALAAAAMIFIVVRPGAGPEQPGHTPGAPGGASSLPGYEMDFAGGQKSVRSGGHDAPNAISGVPLLREGARYTLTIRPETPVDTPVEVAVFLVSGETVKAIEAKVETSEEGAARVVGELPAGIPVGQWELVALVGDSDALPADGVTASALTEGPRLKVMRQKVEVAPPLDL